MGEGVVSWRELWDETAAITGRSRARWLCEIASGYDRDEFLQELDRPVTERGVAHLDAMLARLADGEPLQYVLGRWGFRNLDLIVDRRVLIPRPETETVVEAALQVARRLARPLVCADLGTGSGAIGLSLASELSVDGVTVWLTDQSADALDVARANAAGIGSAAANVRVVHGSWFDALPADLRGGLDLVVSNPPYVAESDAALESIVADWEPSMALFGGTDGLSAIRQIAHGATTWLRPGGWLVLEIGSTQGPAVTDLLSGAGLWQVAIQPDLTGRDRIAVAQRSIEAGGDLTEQ
jgi:release factor glutamine methyltransferase